MEFQELVKIWDAQNKEPLYAINEAALHRRILARSRKARRLAGINEIGLMTIAVLTAAYLFFDAVRDAGGISSFLTPVTFILIGGYVLSLRIRRKRGEGRFDRSMLGELEHAIASSDYIISFSRTFALWFLAPAAVASFLSMAEAAAPLWKWAVVGASFPLAYLLVWVELRRVHLPRKRSLESLREKLMSANTVRG